MIFLEGKLVPCDQEEDGALSANMTNLPPDKVSIQALNQGLNFWFGVG